MNIQLICNFYYQEQIKEKILTCYIAINSFCFHSQSAVLQYKRLYTLSRYSFKYLPLNV